MSRVVGALERAAASVRRRARPTSVERRVAVLGLGPGDLALDCGAIDRIGTVLVELHDRQIPELRRESWLVRERLAREGLAGRVLTDWE